MKSSPAPPSRDPLLCHQAQRLHEGPFRSTAIHCQARGRPAPLRKCQRPADFGALGLDAQAVYSALPPGGKIHPAVGV
jgi:hypothetical protein